MKGNRMGRPANDNTVRAFQEVVKGKPLSKAARDHNVNYSTLRSYSARKGGAVFNRVCHLAELIEKRKAG